MCVLVAASMKSFDLSRAVSSKDMIRCFEALERQYGKSMIETIMYELEVMFGIIFTGSLRYKLSQIDEVLTKLLGDSASEIMMESILNCLKED